MILKKRYENCTIENYIAETPKEKAFKAYILECCESGFKTDVLISGSVGTGKTHMAVGMMKKHGTIKEDKLPRWIYSKTLRFTTVKTLIDDIKKSFKDGSDPFEFYRDIPVLIIDEVGLQYGTKSEKIELYELFDHRYSNMLPTICMSNLKLKSDNGDKNDLLHTLGGRICDRVFNSKCKIFELDSKSKR